MILVTGWTGATPGIIFTIRTNKKYLFHVSNPSGQKRRTYRLEILRNCSMMDFGTNDHHVYFEVVTVLDGKCL